MNPSNIWEAAERSAGPEGRVFVQEVQKARLSVNVLDLEHVSDLSGAVQCSQA